MPPLLGEERGLLTSSWSDRIAGQDSVLTFSRLRLYDISVEEEGGSECEYVCRDNLLVANGEKSQSKGKKHYSNCHFGALSVWISFKLCKKVIKISLHLSYLVRAFHLSTSMSVIIPFIFFSCTNSNRILGWLYFK